MKCRLCQSNKGQKLRATDVFGGTQEHKFWECNNCGVVYLYPYLSPEQEREFYKKEFEKFMSKRVGDHRDWSGAKEHSISNLDQVKRRWKFLQKHLDIHKDVGANKLLEIGCSSGFMLSAFRDYGFDCYGIEPSGEFLEFLHKNDFNAYESFEELVLANNGIKFDIITHFFVFEHISDPLSFLKNTYDLLNEGGGYCG
ncbi:class I SAM-dependent methyltransferase [Campylobacter sp. M4]|uniref:class I SAM-dependent methyltransferase n=1 Tax=Campylobacter sp. M4 TaxID=3424761 RepID=UPI003D33F31C